MFQLPTPSPFLGKDARCGDFVLLHINPEVRLDSCSRTAQRTPVHGEHRTRPVHGVFPCSMLATLSTIHVHIVATIRLLVGGLPALMLFISSRIISSVIVPPCIGPSVTEPRCGPSVTNEQLVLSRNATTWPLEVLFKFGQRRRTV